MFINSNKILLKNNYLFLFAFLTLSFLFLDIPDVSATTQASFMWDPNPEPDVAGYRIFYREQGQSYNYTNPSWEGTETYSTIYDFDESKTYFFVVRAFDTEGYESDDSNEVCLESLNGPNEAPTADAGPDQTVEERQPVLLNGSNSTDADDGIEFYQWVQTNGPLVTLSDSDVQQPSFTAPDVGSEGAALIFELTVVDFSGNQAKDVCTVNVTWQNEPPTANAGNDQTVDEGTTVLLDGSSSLDIDDGIAAYLWTQIGGPTVNLLNPETPNPTFTAPNVNSDGLSLAFDLKVTDAGGLQNTDACIVNVSWQNESPTAIISPDYLETTQETIVTLDGSASTDSDDGIASYLWTQIEGDPVSLSTPTSAVTAFTAPKTEGFDKSLKLKLTVTDHGGLKATADSSIYIIQNEPPTLNSVTISGPVQVDESSGAQYILTANYSDGNSSEVTGLANWSDNSSYANISSDGYLAASSVASDQSCTITASYEGQSDSHNITINDIPSNNSPVVNFSFAAKKKKVAFNDRSIDSDGTIVSWLWDFGDGTYNITQNPEHRYIKFRNYSVTLTVTDNGGLSNTISKTVSITK